MAEITTSDGLHIVQHNDGTTEVYKNGQLVGKTHSDPHSAVDAERKARELVRSKSHSRHSSGVRVSEPFYILPDGTRVPADQATPEQIALARAAQMKKEGYDTHAVAKAVGTILYEAGYSHDKIMSSGTKVLQQIYSSGSQVASPSSGSTQKIYMVTDPYKQQSYVTTEDPTAQLEKEKFEHDLVQYITSENKLNTTYNRIVSQSNVLYSQGLNQKLSTESWAVDVGTGAATGAALGAVGAAGGPITLAAGTGAGAIGGAVFGGIEHIGDILGYVAVGKQPPKLERHFYETGPAGVQIMDPMDIFGQRSTVSPDYMPGQQPLTKQNVGVFEDIEDPFNTAVVADVNFQGRNMKETQRVVSAKEQAELGSLFGRILFAPVAAAGAEASASAALKPLYTESWVSFDTTGKSAKIAEFTDASGKRVQIVATKANTEATIHTKGYGIFGKHFETTQQVSIPTEQLLSITGGQGDSDFIGVVKQGGSKVLVSGHTTVDNSGNFLTGREISGVVNGKKVIGVDFMAGEQYQVGEVGSIKILKPNNNGFTYYWNVKAQPGKANLALVSGGKGIYVEKGLVPTIHEVNYLPGSTSLDLTPIISTPESSPPVSGVTTLTKTSISHLNQAPLSEQQQKQIFDILPSMPEVQTSEVTQEITTGPIASEVAQSIEEETVVSKQKTKHQEPLPIVVPEVALPVATGLTIAGSRGKTREKSSSRTSQDELPRNLDIQQLSIKDVSETRQEEQVIPIDIARDTTNTKTITTNEFTDFTPNFRPPPPQPVPGPFPQIPMFPFGGSSRRKEGRPARLGKRKFRHPIASPQQLIEGFFSFDVDSLFGGREKSKKSRRRKR